MILMQNYSLDASIQIDIHIFPDQRADSFASEIAHFPKLIAQQKVNDIGK